MPTGFAAADCSITREHGVLVTTLAAPSSEEEDFYLMLQHKEPYTEQDIKFGMNRPYIEYCGQGWSWYGHIVRFELHRHRVQIQMDKEAAEHMRNDGFINVTFELGDGQFNDLRRACHETFRGYPYFVDVA